IDAGLVVFLDIQERLDQLALIDANQFPVLPVEIPDSNVGEKLERRAKPAFGHPGPACYTAQFSGLTIEKADQTIALAQRKRAQYDSFRLLERHSFSGRLRAKPALRRLTESRHPVSARRLAVDHPPASSRNKIQNLVTYHTRRRDAIENHH